MGMQIFSLLTTALTAGPQYVQLPTAEFSYGGGAPMMINPVMESQATNFAQTSANPSMGQMQMPEGQAPAPVMGSVFDSNMPQAGANSESASAAGAAGKSSSSKSSTSSSKTKSSDKSKKNSAKSIGIIAGIIGVAFCLIAA